MEPRELAKTVFRSIGVSVSIVGVIFCLGTYSSAYWASRPRFEHDYDAPLIIINWTLPLSVIVGGVLLYALAPMLAKLVAPK